MREPTREMKNILLLEPDSEKTSSLMFLLELADLKCTVVRDIEEVVNWLSTNRSMVNRFDLILLNAYPVGERGRELFTEMTRTTMVPVVYVQREGAYLPRISAESLVVCHVDNLLSCLRECLAGNRVSCKRPARGPKGCKQIAFHD